MSDDQTSDVLARVRDLAALLPGTDEQAQGNDRIFSVERQAFAKVTAADTLHVRAAGDDAAWTSIELSGEADWTLVEDEIARSWELTAPGGLLEAGGR